MARIVDPRTGEVHTLRARTRIGRSRANDLCLDDPRASGEHALIAYAGHGWLLRDLGSRNGSFLGDRRLLPAEPQALAPGDLLGFGAAEASFEVLDLDPPRPAAFPLDEGPGAAPIEAPGDLLLLPDALAPLASIHRLGSGSWVIEQGGEERPVADRDTLTLQGRRFRLSLPEDLDGTWRPAAPPLTLARVRLDFVVSQDEEHVALTLFTPEGPRSLGARSGHYLLLTLARLRSRDAARGLPLGEQGWVHQDELLRMLAIDANVLHVWIHRARRLVADAGVVDAAALIERRSAAGQLRIGMEELTVRRA